MADRGKESFARSRLVADAAQFSRDTMRAGVFTWQTRQALRSTYDVQKRTEWSKNGQQRSKVFRRVDSVTETIGRIPVLTWNRSDEQSHISKLNRYFRILSENTIANALTDSG